MHEYQGPLGGVSRVKPTHRTSTTSSRYYQILVYLCLILEIHNGVAHQASRVRSGSRSLQLERQHRSRHGKPTDATTPPQRGVCHPDTVPRPRHTSAQLYRTGDLTYGRQAVLRDLQHIGRVPFSYFQKALLPPLPSGVDIKHIKSSLARSKKLTRSGRWATFSVDPSVATEKEEDVFKGLRDVFNDIVYVARTFTDRPTTLELVNNPSVAPQSTRPNSSRPDAYLLMVEKKSVSPRLSEDPEKDCWDDIAVSFEFKKAASESAQKDKIIWNLHHVMRTDPCRRATFGITIENRNIRMWFTCRSMTLVSEPFDFVRNVEDTIHLFCCLAFAKDHDLGWDTTMKRVLYKETTDPYKETIQYEITINGTIYQTVETISDFGAEAMRGRGTRVFKAFALLDRAKGKYVAIKDAWRDSDRKREDQILREIMDDIERMGGDIAAAKQHFLTVLNQDDVRIEGIMDDTRQFLRGKDLPDPMSWYNVSPDKEPSSLTHTSSTGNMPLFPVRTAIRRLGFQNVQHKQHFRLVFEEIGEPIFTLQSLGDVSGTLGYTVKGLRYMHMAGWVHRDISSANVLRFEDRGLIMDLEYAKRMDSDQTHEGTADFMACEVEAQAYLFLDQVLASLSDIKTAPPFRANPLHDLESLWWVLMWVLHYHVDSETREPPPKQEATYQLHFPGLNIPEGHSRSRSLQTVLSPDALPESFRFAVLQTDAIRWNLRKAYRVAEEEPFGPNYLDPYLTCSHQFAQLLEPLYRQLKDVDIHLVPLCTLKEQKAKQDAERRNAEMRSTKRRKT
ncbi:hypothetical protein BU15DRAFT_47133 [Melanogaster broomeanus]|nr:hypothetical protein BU15DRAFT_47133 [Melanogaster broomeanus]